MSSTISLTSENFDQAIKDSKEPILVDFWASWCGPCKQVAPILDEIADEKADSLKIAKLNVDDSPDIAQRFSVMSIPTMILFKDGEATDIRIVGARSKEQLLSELGQ